MAGTAGDGMRAMAQPGSRSRFKFRLSYKLFLVVMPERLHALGNDCLPGKTTHPDDIAASSNSPDTIGRRPGVPAKTQGIGSPTVEWLLSRANAWRPCLGKPRVMIRAVALLHRVVLYANKDEVISNETSL